MTLGIVLVIVGALFLLKNLGFLIWVSWNILWPIIVIILGLGMISKKRHHCLICGMHYKHHEGCKECGEGKQG